MGVVVGMGGGGGEFRRYQPEGSPARSESVHCMLIPVSTGDLTSVASWSGHHCNHVCKVGGTLEG